MLRWFSQHYDPQFHYCISVEGQDWKSYDMVRKCFFRNVRYLRINNNKGLPYAMNRLCEYAQRRGDDFVFMSADNARFDVEKVSEFMGVIGENNSMILLGGFFTCQKLWFKDLIKEGSDIFQSPYAGIVYALSLSFWSMEQFDEKVRYAEDEEYWLRIRKIFYPYNPIYTYIPFVVSKKRHEAGGHSSLKSNFDLVKKDIDYINKKYGLEVMGMRKLKNEDVYVYFARWSRFLKSLKEKKG